MRRNNKKNPPNEGVQIFGGENHFHNTAIGNKSRAIWGMTPIRWLGAIVALALVGSTVFFAARSSLFYSGNSLPATEISQVSPPPQQVTQGVTTSQPQTVQNTPTPQSTNPPTLTPTSHASANAVSLYNRIANSSPGQVVTPSDQWTNVSSNYGKCVNEGSHGYHAISNIISGNTDVACIAPSAFLVGNFALQANLTIQQGEGAGLVFGFTPTTGGYMSGSFYYLGACPNGSASCAPKNDIFLDHNVASMSSIQCLGPDPAPDYSSEPGACSKTLDVLQSQINTFTVIVYNNIIYLYIDQVHIYTFSPHDSVPYLTRGQIGFIAIGADVTCPEIDVWQLN